VIHLPHKVAIIDGLEQPSNQINQSLDGHVPYSNLSQTWLGAWTHPAPTSPQGEHSERILPEFPSQPVEYVYTYI
jgi:hypothetical protein